MKHERISDRAQAYLRWWKYKLQVELQRAVHFSEVIEIVAKKAGAPDLNPGRNADPDGLGGHE